MNPSTHKATKDILRCGVEWKGKEMSHTDYSSSKKILSLSRIDYIEINKSFENKKQSLVNSNFATRESYSKNSVLSLLFDIFAWRRYELKKNQYEIQKDLKQRWAFSLDNHSFICTLAIKVWNTGLNYSLEQAVLNRSMADLTKRYWDIMYTRKYLINSLDEFVQDQWTALKMSALDDHMRIFRDNYNHQY